jgi:hypothetical protein
MEGQLKFMNQVAMDDVMRMVRSRRISDRAFEARSRIRDTKYGQMRNR